MANIATNLQSAAPLPFGGAIGRNHSHWIEIGRREFWHHGELKGAEIKCLSGVVWLTEEGELSDSFLRAGETLRIQGRGLVLIEALSDAQLILTGEHA